MEMLRKLELKSRKLEIDSVDRNEMTARVMNYVNSFYDELPNQPGIFGGDLPEERSIDLDIDSCGKDIESILGDLKRHVDSTGINLPSGKYMGYIPGGGLYGAALGDYLAAVTNRYAGLYYVSPGAVKIENILVRWMADVVGYPESSGGTLTSGGSISNLIAMVTARDALTVDLNQTKKAVIYLTDQTHHSVNKAIHIAGMSDFSVRVVRVDSEYRMDAAHLVQTVQEDIRNGKRPFMVIGTAGTTNTGTVDPLTEIAHIAGENGLWFHIDGAYGGLFNLCPEGREVLQGIELSDSVSLDPHKTLFLPYGTGAILVRDRKKLFSSFNASADYLLDYPDMNSEWSPADLSPELTRHFRGLRLWMPLQLHGTDPFSAAQSEKIRLARYFHDQIQSIDGLESGGYPDLSIVTYRYVPKSGDPNVYNDRLMKAVNASRNAFISSTRLNGNQVLRAAVLNFRTHREHIDLFLETLKEETAKLNCV